MAQTRKVKPAYTEKVKRILTKGRHRQIKASEMRDQLAKEIGLTPEVAAALGREMRLNGAGVAPRRQVGYKKPTRKEV